MRFRTAIVLGSLALIVGIIGTTSVVAANVVENDARATLDAELTRGAIVFEELFAHRQSLWAANAKVVAEEPRLKAVVATEEIDHATVLDVARELRRAVDSDLLLLTDGWGHLLADVEEPDAVGFDLRDKVVVADGLAQGTGQGIWTAEGRAYQMASQRLSFGETVVGVLVVGWEIGDELATVAARQTGGAVVVLEGEQTVASSLPAGATRGELPATAVEEGGTHVTITVDGVPYRAVIAELGGDERFRYLVMRPQEEALVTSRRLVRQIYGLGGLAVLAALLLALWLSQRLSRPLRDLVDFTREIAAGRLEPRPPPRGLRELEALGEAMNRMATELSASREQLATAGRLEREMEIATRIQTSILPVEPSLPGYSIAASMDTATEVGGDYYDVIPTRDGGWIAIGDVAGHGLPAGVVMLMLQSATHVLVRAFPDAEPSTALSRINTSLFENVRVRLGQDEYVTFTLLRCSRHGEIVYAGAHEEILVWRKATGECSRWPTPGPWLGVLSEVGPITRDQAQRLEPGDLLLLYTDGATEAMDAEREPFGPDRLSTLLESNADRPVDEIVERIREQVGQWSRERVDDVTLLVIRYDGLGAGAP